jgi:hypothetical protein
VQVVPIGYLTEAEARQLIEQPVKDFALRYAPEASQRVLDLTAGHPYLVQLLCREIVAHKNTQPLALRWLACRADVEAAAQQALSSGRMFFDDIDLNQVDAAGRALLMYLAMQGEAAILDYATLAHRFGATLDQALVLPLRRDLITQQDGGYRFQVELIRRWFADPKG